MSASRTPWRELIPGLITAGVIAVVVYVVLVYAEIGGLRGDTTVVHAAVGSARGIMKGTEVWLAGHRVGKVQAVHYAPVTTDQDSRVVLEMEVLTKHLAGFRRDSWAQIRSGTTLIGNPVVHVTPGTPSAPILASGDTLRTRPQFDTEGVTSQLAVASRQFPAIIENVKMIGVQLEATTGAAGALFGDGATELSVVGRQVGRVARAVGPQGRGTVGLALRDGALVRRIGAVQANADTLTRLLATDAPALGRFRRDSTLARQVRALLDEVSIVRALLAQPAGTGGRALHDAAVLRELTRLERDLAALMEDVKRRPLRYVQF